MQNITLLSLTFVCSIQMTWAMEPSYKAQATENLSQQHGILFDDVYVFAWPGTNSNSDVTTSQFHWDDFQYTFVLPNHPSYPTGHTVALVPQAQPAAAHPPEYLSNALLHYNSQFQVLALEAPCCICQEGEGDITGVVQLPCGHRFHFACVDPWFMQGKNTCPQCRQAFGATGMVD